jgi:hypothetical protein
VIDGRVVLQDGELLTLDLARMHARVAQQYTTIMSRFDRLIR